MKYFILILIAVLGVSLQAQTRIVRSATHSGYAAVSSASISGHVVTGVPMAERVAGATLNGWIGFMPVKRERPTSVDEEPETAVSVRPNPANAVVTLPDVEASARITVFNHQGRVLEVPVEFTEQGARLDVTGLTTGVYHVSVMNGSTSTMHRFVVQK